MVLLCWLAIPSNAQTPPEDFESLLHARGLTASDLSRASPPDWLGRPDPASVPFVLPHHRHVQEDPRRLLHLGSNLLAVAEGSIDDVDLVRLLTVFGLQPRLPGFRGFVPTPPAPPALDEVLRRAGVDEPAARVGELPERLRPILAGLVAAATDSAQAVERSWSGVDAETLEQALSLRDVPRLLPGASVPWPSLNRLVGDGRVAGDVDRAAAMVGLVTAVEVAAAALMFVDGTEVGSAEPWQVETRWGRVMVTGPGADEIDCRDCFVAIDLGGDDRWVREVAKAGRLEADAPSGSPPPPAKAPLLPRRGCFHQPGVAQRATPGGPPERPVVLVVDLGGDDDYRGAFAAGRGGVAVLADLAGNDRYEAADEAQGYGYLGYGLLFDAAGDDRYDAQGGAQGAGVFGAGLLVDAGGRDVYRIHGEGQGFGGPWGCGALVDLGGDDVYRAEPDPAKARGRADYHSDGRVNASNAQGAGVGRRGDLGDGHLWAGGVGVLADVAGGDRYEAGNFAQASGYAYGTGLLLDGAGDDVYDSTYFAQASASHEALALLLDAAGDDRHELATGAGLGYGWDFAVGVLADLGGGDRYRAARLAMGSADLSSLGLFLEHSGDDVYVSDRGVRVLGATGSPEPFERDRELPHRAGEQVRELGLFFDLDGADRYPQPRGCRTENEALWECTGAGGFGWDLARPDDSTLTFWSWLVGGT